MAFLSFHVLLSLSFVSLSFLFIYFVFLYSFGKWCCLWFLESLGFFVIELVSGRLWLRIRCEFKLYNSICDLLFRLCRIWYILSGLVNVWKVSLLSCVKLGFLWHVSELLEFKGRLMCKFTVCKMFWSGFGTTLVAIWACTYSHSHVELGIKVFGQD